MSSGDRQNKPGPDAAIKANGDTIDAAAYVPHGQADDRSWPLTDPMRVVRHEREQAAAQIQRSVKAWRKVGGGAQAGPATIPQNCGAPLAGEVRAKMEPQLGADLSAVKVHTSAKSAEAATQLGARAFTTGNDVHFGSGEYAPGTKEGDRLIAHELTHAVQAQKSGVQRKAAAHEDQERSDASEQHVSQPGEPAELEADAVGDRVADQIHGGGDKDASQPQPEAGQSAAPAIGTKLKAGVVSLSKKNDKKDEKKNVDEPKKDKPNGGSKLKYVPSPKHSAGGWGTPMDLDDATAQSLLDSSIEAGKQRYNYLNGKLYEFQPDNAGGWHGYPIPGTEAPNSVRKALRDAGKISPAEYKKLVKGDK